MRTFFDFEFRAAGLSDIGRQRESNQDEVILAPELGFFGVSDGMGGLPAGGAASRFVKRSLPMLLEELSRNWTALRRSPEQVGEQLQDCVQLCSDSLFEDGNREAPPYRYGATLAGVQLWVGCAVFVWLGDSRGYVLRKQRHGIEQITEDMNLAGRMVRAGEITKEEALHRPESSRLTAFVGMRAPASPEVRVTPVCPGDRLLLCSDGLYGMVPEPEIVRILRSSDSQETVCRRLVEAANENGGEDNISAVCIRISGR